MSTYGSRRPGSAQIFAQESLSQLSQQQHSRNPYRNMEPPNSAVSNTSSNGSNSALLPPTRGSSSVVNVGWNGQAANSRQALLGRQASFDDYTNNAARSDTSLVSGSSDDVARGAVGAGYGPYSPNLGSADGHSLEDYYDDKDSINEFSSTSKYNLMDPTPDDFWDPKDDANDKLHSLSQKDAFKDSRTCTVWTLRGWLNMIGLMAITSALVGLFAGYPIFDYLSKLTQMRRNTYGWNVGGTNASGQVPEISGFPSLIDNDTPLDRRGYTGYDGQAYELVFSDEFNTNGRTFYNGDDPCVFST